MAITIKKGKETIVGEAVEEIIENEELLEETGKQTPNNKASKTIKEGKPRSKLVIILYAISGILVIYGGYMVYYTINYIKSYYSTTTTSISDEMTGVIQYIVTNSIIYFVYALLIYIGARILKGMLDLEIRV